jgi:hypothetical protein
MLCVSLWDGDICPGGHYRGRDAGAPDSQHHSASRYDIFVRDSYVGHLAAWYCCAYHTPGVDRRVRWVALYHSHSDVWVHLLRDDVCLVLHLQRNYPVEAHFWTKLFAPPLHQREKCFAAIDELVAQLRYLQQPQEKTLTSAQLGTCLNRYFRSLQAPQSAGGISGAGGARPLGNSSGEEQGPEARGGEQQQEPPFCGHIPSMEVLALADQAAFLALVEAEAGGRLAPIMQRLAKQTFHKVVEAALARFADEVVRAPEGHAI